MTAPKPGNGPPSLERWARDTFARRDEVLTRAEARELLQRANETQAEENAAIGDRVGRLETWRANVTGRTVGFAIIGAVFIAVVASVVTRLITGT